LGGRREPVLDQVRVQVAPGPLGVPPVDHRQGAPVRVTVPDPVDDNLLAEDKDLDEVLGVPGDLPHRGIGVAGIRHFDAEEAAATQRGLGEARVRDDVEEVPLHVDDPGPDEDIEDGRGDHGLTAGGRAVGGFPKK